MAIELEAKVRIENPAAFRARLVKANATRISHRRELNIYFDTPDRKLLAKDQGLRIRSLWPLDDDQASAKHVITFKGPQAAGSELKSREEIEFKVDDHEAATQLLERLGYQPELGFEKRRESWKLGGCIVEIDEMPLLGVFVEIEGDNRESVINVLALLELDADGLLTESYISMMAREVAQRGLKDRVVRF